MDADGVLTTNNNQQELGSTLDALKLQRNETMNKLMMIATSIFLAMSANSSFAAMYNVEVNLLGSVSGGGGGSQTGSGFGIYDDVTQVMTLSYDATVVANGLFGIGKGTMQQAYEGIFNFSTLKGTNEVLACTNISGSSCNLVPSGPQTLKSVSPINWSLMTFVTTSTFSIATTTQNWTITSFEAQAPEVPIPAAAWLFGSAVVGLAGVARRRNQVG